MLAGATAYTWSDMFDPHHNAVKKDYYLVAGDLGGSWDGLSKDVVIVNWNFDKRDASLKFFADRGHRQVIAGYYDADPAQVKKWLSLGGQGEGSGGGHVHHLAEPLPGPRGVRGDRARAVTPRRPTLTAHRRRPAALLASRSGSGYPHAS